MNALVMTSTVVAWRADGTGRVTLVFPLGGDRLIQRIKDSRIRRGDGHAGVDVQQEHVRVNTAWTAEPATRELDETRLDQINSLLIPHVHLGDSPPSCNARHRHLHTAGRLLMTRGPHPPNGGAIRIVVLSGLSWPAAPPEREQQPPDLRLG